MNQLTKMFDGHELTIIDDKGDPKFLLRDVCKILGLGQVSGVTRRLDDDVIWNHPIEDSLGRTQIAVFVNEDGLYDVILDSRKPEAKKFRKWITSEVLPYIRKTGGYQLDTSQLSPELQMFNSLFSSMAKQELENKQRKKEIKETKQEVADVRSIFSINPKSSRKEVNDLIIMISKTRNSLNAYRDVRNESYQRLEDRARCDLNIRLQNMRDRMRKAGASVSAINRKNKMDVIESDTRLMEIYLTVVKEMAIKNNVKPKPKVVV